MSADKLRGMGWSPSISLNDGIGSAYEAYLADQIKGRTVVQ